MYAAWTLERQAFRLTSALNKGAWMNTDETQSNQASGRTTVRRAYVDLGFPADGATEYFKRRRLWQGTLPLLRGHRGEFYQFNGKVFQRLEDKELQADAYTFLRDVDREQAKKTYVESMMANLYAMCRIPSQVAFPAYLEGRTWETKVDWIAVQNGVLDVQALIGGENVVLKPHTPAFVATVLLPFAYDAFAECPRWHRFVEEVLPDPDSRRLLQEIFGYCLTYDLSQQKFFLFLGDGGNGKGVITRILRMLLGEENVSTVPLTHLGKRFYLVGTMGKLVNFCNEVDNARDLDEAVIKQFTGEDPMQFERKYKEVFSAMPTAKLIISGNAWLPFKDRSEGMWRRLVPLHFPINIPEARQNKNLTRDLLPQLSGIFNWAVEGLCRLRQQGRFTIPAGSEVMIGQFRLEANNALRFLEESTVENGNGYVGTVALYTRYRDWCVRNGHQALDHNEFVREVTRKYPGVKKRRRGEDGMKVTSFIGLSMT
jgi:putative DNA primase/helicase